MPMTLTPPKSVLGQRPPESYRGEADFFGVYCHERQAVYLVPVDHVPDVAAHLRLSPPRNGQSKGIRWASEYLLG